MKGMKIFGMKGKLTPHYNGPFPILEKCLNVAYKLELPPFVGRSARYLPGVAAKEVYKGTHGCS
jgi:hypothetical protein